MKALLLIAILLAPTLTPTATPSPTSTSTATATTVPSATATPSPTPSPTPPPTGPQGSSGFCLGLVGCLNLTDFIGSLFDNLLAWLGHLMGGWLGVTPAVSPAGSAPPPSATSPATATPPVSGTVGTVNAPDLVSQVLGIVTTETDPTGAGMGPLLALYGGVMTVAQQIIAGLMVLFLLVTYWEGLLRGVGRVWVQFVVRMSLVFLYLSNLNTAAHLWAQFLGGLTQSFNDLGLGGFMSTLLALLAPTVDNSTGGLATGTFALLLGLCLIVAFVVLMLLLLYQRLVALALQVLVFTLAPLAVAALVLPLTRAQGKMWIQTYVQYSLYAPLTAACIQVLDKLVFYINAQPGFATPLVRAVLGIVCLGSLLSVPKLASRLVGGGLEMSAFGVPRLSSAKKLLPLL